MFRLISALLVSVLLASAPAYAASKQMTMQGPSTELGFTTKPGGGAAQTTVNCRKSNEHFRICTDMKATCDKIHESSPSHGCGCTKGEDGELESCNSGPT